MPKQLSRKRAASEEYEADGGFVEDAPKSKKSKAANVKETKPKSSPKTEDSESQYWELGRTRRVQLNEFKGKQLVDIREFYEKEEQMLPGKKGISLNIEQFTTFVEQLPAIEKALKAKGISIPRPKYGASSTEEVEEDDEDEEDSDAEEPEKKAVAEVSEDEENEEPLKPVKASRLDKFKHKANHEATSDEDN